LTPEPIRGWILFGMSAKDSERGLQSGELARSAGVSPDTLRHYERLGVLKEPPRTESGYRLYPPDALSRVLLIRNALAVGFSLDELTRILRLRDSGQAPCREVAEMAQEKVSGLDLQIEQLIQLRDSLKLTVKEWERRLKKTPAGNRAGLLESLPQRKDHRTAVKKRRTP
jgi:DNA-binding transcriptional MerR regulator